MRSKISSNLPLGSTNWTKIWRSQKAILKKRALMKSSTCRLSMKESKGSIKLSQGLKFLDLLSLHISRKPLWSTLIRQKRSLKKLKKRLSNTIRSTLMYKINHKLISLLGRYFLFSTNPRMPKKWEKTKPISSSKFYSEKCSTAACPGSGNGSLKELLSLQTFIGRTLGLPPQWGCLTLL